MASNYDNFIFYILSIYDIKFLQKVKTKPNLPPYKIYSAMVT